MWAGSGRPVNRAFYETLRGELGCQWTGLSHVCPHRGGGLFVLMAARDWRDCRDLVYTECVSDRRISRTRCRTDPWLGSQQSYKPSPVFSRVPAGRSLREAAGHWVSLRTGGKSTRLESQDDSWVKSRESWWRDGSEGTFHLEKTCWEWR